MVTKHRASLSWELVPQGVLVAKEEDRPTGAMLEVMQKKKVRTI